MNKAQLDRIMVCISLNKDICNGLVIECAQCALGKCYGKGV